MSASFNYHFLGTFWQKQFQFVEVVTCTEDAGLAMMDRLLHPDLHNVCQQCEGLFLRRLRQRLSVPPALSLHEKFMVTKEIYSDLACDPLLASMHEVEELHAHARVAAARSMDRRKQLPTRLFCGQYLSRWKTLHERKMGKLLRSPLTVKQTILKRLQPVVPRTLTGHDIFVKRANEERRGRGERGKQSYVQHLRRTHTHTHTVESHVG